MREFQGSQYPESVSERYEGQGLGSNPKIAVISNDALGNFAIATAVLQSMRVEHPGCELWYFAGNRVKEFCEASDLFDHWFPLHGNSPGATAQALAAQFSTFDYVFNMEHSAAAKWMAAALPKADGYVSGPCLDPEARGDWDHAADSVGDLWRDKEWINPEICKKYPFLKSGFIAEIFCRSAYVETSTPAYKIPCDSWNGDLPDILIATSASLPEKLWPTEKWVAVLAELKAAGKTVGILGAPPKPEHAYWKGVSTESELVEMGLAADLRGKLSLPQVAWACGKVSAVLTLDNGILHIAASQGVPVVGLFRYGIHRLWAPPYVNVKVIHPGAELEVASIEVDTVLKAVVEAC